jgi:hypothetical protein
MTSNDATVCRFAWWNFPQVRTAEQTSRTNAFKGQNSFRWIFIWIHEFVNT